MEKCVSFFPLLWKARIIYSTLEKAPDEGGKFVNLSLYIYHYVIKSYFIKQTMKDITFDNLRWQIECVILGFHTIIESTDTKTKIPDLLIKC